MALFSYIPTYSINKSVKPRVLTTNFGDGYSQRVGDGLNTQRQEWNLEFVGDTTNITAIQDFLLDTGGYEAFTWTPPLETTTYKFVYTNLSVAPMSDRIYKLSVTFSQVFDLN